MSFYFFGTLHIWTRKDIRTEQIDILLFSPVAMIKFGFISRPEGKTFSIWKISGQFLPASRHFQMKHYLHNFLYRFMLVLCMLYQETLAAERLIPRPFKGRVGWLPAKFAPDWHLIDRMQTTGLSSHRRAAERVGSQGEGPVQGAFVQIPHHPFLKHTFQGSDFQLFFSK